MKRLIYLILFVAAAVAGINYLASSLRIEGGRSASGGRGKLAFATRHISRDEYIAELRRTMRPSDPELHRRILAVEKSPAWD